VERVSSLSIGLWLVSTGLMLSWPGSTRAQSFGTSSSGMGPGTMPSYSLSGVGSYFGGSSAYIPFGGTTGGFVPYSPGPGGGLGVQPRMRNAGAQMQAGGMGLMGPRPSLGLIRGQLTPLAPIGLGAMGTRAGAGMSSMGGLIRRTPSGASMGGMSRPPVGNYPFRQPPSLLGPATATPSMTM
jgi:hypothetical protein